MQPRVDDTQPELLKKKKTMNIQNPCLSSGEEREAEGKQKDYEDE